MGSIAHFFVAGGWVMYPLLLLSLTAIAVIIDRALAYKQQAFLAPGLLERVIRYCDEGRFAEAEKECSQFPGPVAACLGTVLKHRQLPVEDMERHVQEVGEGYSIQLERFLPVLDTTTTISPLLGLLGTLFGMIGTFRAISASQNQGANDSILSGVGTALYATATGLSIAVVCFCAYNYFAARQRMAMGEAEQAATKLINALRRYELAATAAGARPLSEAARA